MPRRDLQFPWRGEDDVEPPTESPVDFIAPRGPMESIPEDAEVDNPTGNAVGSDSIPVPMDTDESSSSTTDSSSSSGGSDVRRGARTQLGPGRPSGVQTDSPVPANLNSAPHTPMSNRTEPEPQPERVVENKRASVADDEEFSDFSF